MNRYIKKAVCLTAAIAITVAGLAGCGKQSEDKSAEGAMGRYLEEEIALPENTGKILAMERLDDNSLSLFTEDKETGALSVEVKGFRKKLGGRYPARRTQAF